MPYVIAAACIDVTDKSCMEECPVDCIYEGSRKLYINPVECIDCGACEPVCPVEAISQDRWQDGGGPARPLRDASTGDTVATIMTKGPDVGAMLEHARTVGGPALRALSFTERAAILKVLGRHLSGHLDELVALSARTGATRADTRLDVDGGIATLAVYASKGSRELPASNVLADGASEPLSKGGTFAGRHLLTPKLGVAVQVHAFNFPVWGMLEKLAPAFLAGLPSVVKPAAQTAYLTELAVRRITESGLLPPGALALLAAGPTGLLENLTSQDTLAFTGSAATALALRTHPVVAGRAVAFNAEADSLNCSILGTDVQAGDPEFTLYVDQLVTEMTAKAGQKCTAIRRAFVPDTLADAVSDAVIERLRDVIVGDPADPATAMGPLASLAQREEVRTAVHRLAADTRLIFGDLAKVTVHGGDAEHGAFLSPVLLRCDENAATAPHEVEAFGPGRRRRRTRRSPRA